MRYPVLLLASLVLLGSSPAFAIDPDDVRYLPEPDALFWFIHITDTHVGADLGYGSQDTDHLDWVVGEAFDVVQPEFIVLTGDIVDGTNGLFVPTQQYQSEWDEYRALVDGAGMDVSLLHDIVGNHDTYSDEGATYYLANSLVGTGYEAVHEAWWASLPFGDYLFVGANTADLTGSFPGLDAAGLVDDELAFIDEALTDGADARLAFLYTHHPYGSLDFGGDEALDLLEAHRVSLWGNGHVHTHEVQTWDETVHFNLDTAGKGEANNFAVVGVDGDGVAVKAGDIEAWPFVLITAPVDLGLGGGNPHAGPISTGQSEAFVRALVFDVDPDVLAWLSIDGGPAEPMEQVAPSVWQASFDATTLDPGVHALTVEADSPSGADSHSIQVEVRITQCDDGQDNDGNGFVDHPDDGGCWGLSDDLEEGWEPPADDDDSAVDDDDSAADDDDVVDDDDALDDDDAADDDDSAAVLAGSGCGCAQAGVRDLGVSGGIGLLLLALLLRRRTTPGSWPGWWPRGTTTRSPAASSGRSERRSPRWRLGWCRRGRDGRASPCTAATCPA